MHRCEIEDQTIIARRANPLEHVGSGSTTPKSKCTAATWRYLQLQPQTTCAIYGLAEKDVDLILGHKKKARRYDRYTRIVEEFDVYPKAMNVGFRSEADSPAVSVTPQA